MVEFTVDGMAVHMCDECVEAAKDMMDRELGRWGDA
jgi:hypothetical protein